MTELCMLPVGRRSENHVTRYVSVRKIAESLIEAAISTDNRLVFTDPLYFVWMYNRLIGQMTHEGAISSRALVC